MGWGKAQVDEARAHTYTRADTVAMASSATRSTTSAAVDAVPTTTAVAALMVAAPRVLAGLARVWERWYRMGAPA